MQAKLNYLNVCIGRCNWKFCLFCEHKTFVSVHHHLSLMYLCALVSVKIVREQQELPHP